MNTEMQRTCRLLSELLPAWVVITLGIGCMLCAALAWPWSGPMARLNSHTFECVPALLLGALGVTALLIGGSRLVRSHTTALPDQARSQP